MGIGEEEGLWWYRLMIEEVLVVLLGRIGSGGGNLSVRWPFSSTVGEDAGLTFTIHFSCVVYASEISSEPAL